MESLAIIVLSGGFSSRMGMEKGLVPFKGKPLIEHVLTTASGITDNIMIIANNEGYEQFGYPVFGDLLKEKGPIGGIHAGLTHSNAIQNLVLPCDMPLMTLAFLKYLLDQTGEIDQIVVPRYNGKIEPLCAVYNCSCLPVLKRAAESSDLSLHGLIRKAGAKFIDLDRDSPHYSPYLFSNVNSMKELKTLATPDQ